MTPLDVAVADALRPWLAAWAIAAGACVGSFLNVVVARLPAGQSVVRPRSRCPRCGGPIAWYDNLPVISWLLLRARCRRCRAPISVRYPVVELLGAGAAGLAFARHGFTFPGLAEFGFVAILLALAFIDLDTWLLPNALTWPLLGLGLVAGVLRISAAPGFLAALAGAVLGFAAFAVIALVGEKVFHREAMGFGDVWLLAGLGAFQGVAALLPIVLLASLQGSVVGLLLIVLGKGQPGPPPRPPDQPPSDEEDWVPPKNAVPFGPFLVAGALEWLYLSGPLAALVPTLGFFR